MRIRPIVLAPMLAVACKRTPGPPPYHRLDASVREDVLATDRRPDVAGGDVADDVSERSRLVVYVVGGGGRVREGAPVQIRVVRPRGAREYDVEVTSTSAVRVEPPDRGAVDPSGVFRGRGRGRVEIVATQGGDEARSIIEVSDELPAGTNVLPTLQVSGGLVALAVWFEARPNGTIRTQMEFMNRSLVLEGRPAGRSFPITVLVREDSPLSSPTRASGVLILDRWAGGRLDAHGTLRVDDRAVHVRFAVMVPDASRLTGVPTAAPRPGLDAGCVEAGLPPQ